MWHRNTVAAVAVLTLVVGGSDLWAQPEKSPPSEQGCGCWKAFASSLGLSDKQQEQIRSIHAAFQKKTTPVKKQLSALHHDKREAMRNVLTPDQRIAVQGLLKERWNSKWQAIAAKLELSDEQKQRIDKIRDTFAKQFHDLAAQPARTADQFHKLRGEKLQAIGRELTGDQRAKLTCLVRHETHQGCCSAARHKEWQAIGEKLGVTAAQKEQFKKIRAEFAPRIAKTAAEFDHLDHERRKAVKKVLTTEQLAKLREMRKGHCRSDK